MNISEIKGEAALDALADMLEPATEILADPAIREAYEKKDVDRAQKIIGLVKLAIKNHKQAVIQLLAASEQEDPETYKEKINLLTLPRKFMELLQDPALQEVLPLPGQKKAAESSGSATENTAASEQ